MASGTPSKSLEVARRSEKNGEWGRPKGLRIERSEVPSLPDPADRKILACLFGAEQEEGAWYYSRDSGRASFGSRLLKPALAEALLPQILQTGRAWIRRSDSPDGIPLTWDDGEPWRFQMEVSPSGPEEYRLEGRLERGSERGDLMGALPLSENFVVQGGRVARLNHGKAFPWISLLSKEGHIAVPRGSWEKFHLRVLSLPGEAPMILPEECNVERIRPAPRPHLVIRKVSGFHRRDTYLAGPLLRL